MHNKRVKRCFRSGLPRTPSWGGFRHVPVPCGIASLLAFAPVFDTVIVWVNS